MRGLLVLALLASSAGNATAQGDEPSDDERAAMHFRAAQSYFDDENFEQALVEFQAARELSERPEMLYNIGLTLERLGRWDEAADAHRQFLEVAPDHPDASEAERRMTRSRERAARERDTGERVAPGDDTLAENASAEGDDTPGDAVQPPEPESGGPGATPWIVLGASAALGAVALGTGLAAHGLHGDLEDDCPGGVCPADRAGDIDRGQALGRASTALSFIALAGAVTGVVLFFVGGDDGDEDRVALEMAPTRGGGYVQGRLTF